MAREHVDVRFRVPKDRSAPLTWGQQRVVDLMADLRPDHAPLNLKSVNRIKSKVTTEDVASAIKEVVEECESVRTLFAPGAHAEGQQVVRQGTVRVLVATTDRATYRLAKELASELAAAEFGNEDLPIRVGILADRDGPVHLVLVISHLASDFLGLRRLVWHLRHVLEPSPHTTADTSVITHPVDISHWENSAAGQQEGARALLRHERTLLRMPQSMLPRLPIEPLNPRYQYVEIRTAAGALCLSHLAARHGVSETAVGYAILSLVLSHVSSLQRAHFQVCVGNRFDRAFAAAVATVTQDVPSCVTVDDSDFDTLLRRSAGAVRQATMTGRFPHRELVAMRERVEERRGFPLDLSFWFNSRLFTRVPVDAPSGPQLREEGARTSVRWVGGDRRSTSTLFAYLDRVKDMLAVRTLVDTAFVTRDEAEQWLRAFESILVAAVRRPELGTRALATDAGLTPFNATADWAKIDHGWVHLPTASERLRKAFPGVSLRLSVGTQNGNPSLVGIVSDPLSCPDLNILSRFDVAEVFEDCKVGMRPHRFIREGEL